MYNILLKKKDEERFVPGFNTRYRYPGYNIIPGTEGGDHIIGSFFTTTILYTFSCIIVHHPLIEHLTSPFFLLFEVAFEPMQSLTDGSNILNINLKLYIMKL